MSYIAKYVDGLKESLK